MSVKIKLHSKKWNDQQFPNTLVCGHLEGNVSGLSKLKDMTEIVSEISNVNGFYSLIWTNSNTTYAAVDHIRSIPLFYGMNDNTVYLSDSAEWVRNQINDTIIDENAKNEFLLAGFVTGSDTLYTGVKQIQAGELLKIDTQGNEPRIIKEFYYRFIHKEPDIFHDAELKVKLSQVIENVIERLIAYANGRQIVIPLSGGYDSRLIAVALRKHNYNNVVCFTYGLRGNREAVTSQKVAKALGYEWTFIEYTSEAWREIWRSEDSQNYRRLASNHSSLPHIQDWLAIKELKANKVISSDAVIVPGHSGDFVAGSHIPEFVFCKKHHSEEQLLEAIIENHLSNSPFRFNSAFDMVYLKRRIKTRIGLSYDGTDVGFANLYELWDWQERQSKYIVNSVRVYEQFDYDWWLPLWDLDFVRFWQKIPLQLRKDRLWYKNWIEFYYIQDAELRNLGNASERPMVRMLKSIAMKLPTSIFYKVQQAWRGKQVSRHFLGFDGLVTEGDVEELYKNGFNIIGIYSKLFIESKW